MEVKLNNHVFAIYNPRSKVPKFVLTPEFQQWCGEIGIEEPSVRIVERGDYVTSHATLEIVYDAFLIFRGNDAIAFTLGRSDDMVVIKLVV